MGGDVKFTAKVRVEFFPERVQQLVNRPGGPASNVVKQTAEAVLNAAKPLIGKKYSGTTGKVTDGRSGRLRDSGRVEKGSGASWSVVFDHPAALIHHDGASPHMFDGQGKLYSNPNPGSSSRGRTPFRKRGPFGHPGHKGNPYLINAAKSLGLNTTEGGTRVGRLRGEGGRFISFPRSI